MSKFAELGAREAALAVARGRELAEAGIEPRRGLDGLERHGHRESSTVVAAGGPRDDGGAERCGLLVGVDHDRGAGAGASAVHGTGGVRRRRRARHGDGGDRDAGRAGRRWACGPPREERKGTPATLSPGRRRHIGRTPDLRRPGNPRFRSGRAHVGLRDRTRGALQPGEDCGDEGQRRERGDGRYGDPGEGNMESPPVGGPRPVDAGLDVHARPGAPAPVPPKGGAALHPKEVARSTPMGGPIARARPAASTRLWTPSLS